MRKSVIVAIAALLLVSLLAVCLTACNPDENEAIAGYREKLQAKGYDNFEVVDKTDNKADYIMIWTLSATKNGEGENAAVADYVTVTEFKSEEDAKAYAEKIVVEGVTVKCEGVMVFMGTEQGVADAMA